MSGGSHRRTRVPLRLLVAALAAAVPDVRAETVTVPAAADNTLYEDAAGGISNGAGEHLFAGRNLRGEIRRGLVAFDVAAFVPPGAVIEEVSLALHLSRTRLARDATVSLHRVEAAWGEGDSAAGDGEGGGAPASPGDATWLHRFFDGEIWDDPGGDFAVPASASAAAGGRGFVIWSSSALAEDVQAWVDAPATNFGWILIGNEGESERATSKRFDTRENRDPALRPALTVVFSAPRCGDVNADGLVNTTDARLIQRCAVGQIPCRPVPCDVTGDGRCDIGDAQRIQRFAVGQVSESSLLCPPAR